MKYLYLFLILLLIVQSANAQIQTKYFPDGNALAEVNFTKNQISGTKTITLPAFDEQKLIDADQQNVDESTPFRFGKGFDINLNLSNGTWSEVPGGRVWSLKFSSKNAYSLNFVFTDFYLSDNAELSIVNGDGTILYGVVNSSNNPDNGYFMTDLIQGNAATIYLFEPLGQQGKSRFTLKRAVHAYKNTFPDSTSSSKALSCHNDINCFAAWDLSSDGVGLALLADGTALCSGTLLMTAEQNFRPFFLTAFHCIDINPYNGVLSSAETNASQNWLFKFQFKKTTCTGSITNTGVTYNGSTFRAARVQTDFALVELNTTPAGNTEIAFAGWDRRANAATSGTNIHHPAGAVMKISFDNNALVSNNATINWGAGVISPQNSHWTAILDNGTAEGGSSGSAIFDQNRRVVGQLHGGANGCAPITKHYGRFDQSWTGGGTNATRLSNWLDPCGTGAMTTNTTRSPTITGNNSVCQTGTSFSIPGLPAGSTVNWTSSTNLNRTSNQGANPATFSANSYGNAWIQAVITRPGVCGTRTLRRTVVASGMLVEVFTTTNPGPQPGMANVVVNVVNGTKPFTYFVNSGPARTSWDSNWIVSVPCNSSVNIRVDSQNSCGAITSNRTIFAGCSGSFAMTASPNPTSSDIFIDATAQEFLSQRTTATEVYGALNIKLYDFNGALVLDKQIEKSTSRTSVDVSELKKGTYILRIIGKEIDETHQIVKE